MKMKDVYIINTSSYLPNDVITNDKIEEYMGFINNKASRTKALILRNNKIKERYYAFDKDGNTTHTNAELVSLAIRDLIKHDPTLAKRIELLACGTSSPDQIMPSHAVMVHGELPEFNSIEVVSPSGVCCSGMHALKYAYLSIKAGEKSLAVVTGSERLAKTLRSDNYEEEVAILTKIKDKPILAFEKDFLRWMLSDGAGSFLLSDKPNEETLSLKIEWVEAISYANNQPVCMYMGADLKEGNLVSYKDYPAEEISKQSIFAIKQDAKILGDKIISLGFGKLKDSCDKHNFNASNVDHFLVHLSSYYFEDKIDIALKNVGISIPKENWFTNLETVGNVGSGSIYLMLDEIFKSGKLKKGQTILLAVPESSRFSYVFTLLTVI